MNARSFTPLKYGNNHTQKNIRLHMKYKKQLGRHPHCGTESCFEWTVPVTNIAPNVPAKYNNPLNSIIAYTPT